MIFSLLCIWFQINFYCFNKTKLQIDTSLDEFSCSYLNWNEISISIWCQGRQVLCIFTFWIASFFWWIDEILNDVFYAVDSSKYHSYNAKDAKKQISSNLYLSNHTIKSVPENQSMHYRRGNQSQGGGSHGSN